MNKRPTVAVVGSGISGLTAAYILRKAYDVTLYEAAGRLGGHTHTHTVADRNGNRHNIDSGFIIHNIHTYPLLLRLFKELQVETTPTDLSMSVSCRDCGLEYAVGKGLSGIVAMPSAILRPQYLRLLRTIKLFFKEAKAVLNDPHDNSITLGEFLDSGKYDSYFSAHFILPIISGIWSCDFDEAKLYPARSLFQFLHNHQLLEIGDFKDKGDWRTVVGGSSVYIQKITPLLHKVVGETAVTNLQRKKNGISLTLSNGEVNTFNKAIIATHPDQALALLSEVTQQERQVLGSFQYRKTTTQLHTDTSLLPIRKKAASSWNCLITSCGNIDTNAHFSYDMNRIEHIDSPDHYIVSLGSADLIQPSKVTVTMEYSHPLFTLKSVAAQASLPSLNDERLAFAGAYHGWGFHEDGCRSGAAAAAALGVEW